MTALLRLISALVLAACLASVSMVALSHEAALTQDMTSHAGGPLAIATVCSDCTAQPQPPRVCVQACSIGIEVENLLLERAVLSAALSLSPYRASRLTGLSMPPALGPPIA